MAQVFRTIPSEYHLNLLFHLGSKLGTVPVSHSFSRYELISACTPSPLWNPELTQECHSSTYWEDQNVKLAILTQPSKQDILIHISNCLDNHLASKKMTNLHMQARLSEVWKKATLTPAVKLHADLSPTETLINLVEPSMWVRRVFWKYSLL